MSDEVELSAVRVRVASLLRQSEEAKKIDSQLREANNQLAYLTGRAFVVVDDGRSKQVCGVSPEVKNTRVSSLFLSLTEDGRRIKVRSYLSGGMCTIFLDFIGRICFEIEEDDDGRSSVFSLTAFPTREAARAYAKNDYK